VKSLIRGITFVLLLGSAFVAGFIVRGRESVTAQEIHDFPLLTEAVAFVNEVFVKEKPEDKEIEYELIRSYLRSLGDPNTFFIEPVVAASESDVLAGRYGGIGVEIQRNEDSHFVLYPFEGSSAERVGIRDGDLIVSINGEIINLGSSMDVVRQALRGEIVEGSGVTLVVRNINEEVEREYFVPFDEVLVPSVTWRPLFEDESIGYINISRFTNRTPDEFSEAVAGLREAEVTSLILDLRGNAGGLLQESIQIAGEFFDGGLLSSEERVSGDTVKEDEAGGLLLDLPLVVLVNSGTASASEIVAGAIQARDRGILIGQQTYGKGSIQSIFGLSDESSIHVTVALWHTPDGSLLDGIGLTPDITMIPDENGRNVELGEAIRHLQSIVAE